MKNHLATDASLFLLRVSLGLYMFLAGLGKVQGEFKNGIGSFYEGKFKDLQPDWLADVFALPYGYALPWLEVIVGVLVVTGLFGRLASVVSAAMVASFTIALGLAFDSVAAQPSGAGGSYSANYIQVAAYLALATIGMGQWAIHVSAFKRKAKSKRD